MGDVIGAALFACSVLAAFPSTHHPEDAQQEFDIKT